MQSRPARVVAGMVLAFIIGLAISIANGRDAIAAFGGSLVFSLITGGLIAILAWAADTAARKGYSPWVILPMVLILNVFGILLLLLLPVRPGARR